jgi:hypothetical protein
MSQTQNGLFPGCIQGYMQNYWIVLLCVVMALQMLDYNVPLGKLNRGMAVLDVVRSLSNGDVAAQKAAEARTLGWCIEFVSERSAHSP